MAIAEPIRTRRRALLGYIASMLNAPLYPQRRARLAQALRDAGGGIAIVPTAPSPL